MRFRYADNGITTKTKCVSCEMTAREIRKEHDNYAIEDSYYSEKLDGWLCFPCRESMQSYPQGTVIIYYPQEARIEKYVVYEHEDQKYSIEEVYDVDQIENLENWEYDDDEGSPIHFSYHRTDGWRGYYEPEAEGWKNLHSDCILSYSEDARQLKEFDVDVKKMLWELGYEFAVCFGRTSNLFSCGYDIMIRKNREMKILREMALYTKLMQLNAKYRDPERFRLTALTGKSGDFDKKDKLLAEASKRLEQGEDFETIKEDILAKAKEE